MPPLPILRTSRAYKQSSLDILILSKVSPSYPQHRCSNSKLSRRTEYQKSGIWRIYDALLMEIPSTIYIPVRAQTNNNIFRKEFPLLRFCQVLILHLIIWNFWCLWRNEIDHIFTNFFFLSSISTRRPLFVKTANSK
ncbi:hypothetical protein ACMFMG_009225 [Clarireedia jacksonii]